MTSPAIAPVHKETISIGVAEAEDKYDLYFFCTIPNEKEIIKRKISDIQKKYSSKEIVYKAGPCVYGFRRFLTAERYTCPITAPSTIPELKSNNIKNDHRDSKNLARLFRMGELKYIWIPDKTHKAIRELVKVRNNTHKDVKKAKQRIQIFLLKYDRKYPDKSWSYQNRTWLTGQSFSHPALQISFQTY